MEFSNFGRSTKVPVRSKYPSIQYPTTSASRGGEQLHHHHQQLWCHPQHPLVRFTSPEPFTCMGCKEYGAGTRFACQHCNHQLHEFCALPPNPTTLNTHPLHPHHPLRFSSKPVKGGGMMGKRCYVCNKATAGYTYSCSCSSSSSSACSFQMHPCCARLSTQMSFPLAHPHPLILMPSTTTTGDFMISSSSCGECRSKRSGRVYRCTAQGCDYRLHAVCAKNMVNGLRANGIKGPTSLEKPTSRLAGAFSKIATVVVAEFVGGLIGGLGQGVGDVLGQTIAAGKAPTGLRLD